MLAPWMCLHGGDNRNYALRASDADLVLIVVRREAPQGSACALLHASTFWVRPHRTQDSSDTLRMEDRCLVLPVLSGKMTERSASPLLEARTAAWECSHRPKDNLDPICRSYPHLTLVTLGEIAQDSASLLQQARLPRMLPHRSQNERSAACGHHLLPALGAFCSEVPEDAAGPALHTLAPWVRPHRRKNGADGAAIGEPRLALTSCL
mmetsp:Transcript_17908/g.38093  ORF Transcript_17908/g.38093 Transcript_17908/m.38093 type:complete len:208 (-) Transcript_17908:315-938(-)